MTQAAAVKGGTYRVFARRECHEALEQVGTLSVAPGASVEEAVRRAHGDEWLEMVAIPEDALTWAIVDETREEPK